MEEEKREHESKMKKMEAEMEQVFEMKVKEKKQKLKDSELELTRRHEERKKVELFFPLCILFLNFFNILGTWASSSWTRRASKSLRARKDRLGAAEWRDSRWNEATKSWGQ